ncbi:MAG: hypothetical protein EOS12_27060 [Mesorhizobium sp.]|nr:MAG: hypothetical protein EOS12_27060 [Mesorhizobium sp.]
MVAKERTRRLILIQPYAIAGAPPGRRQGTFPPSQCFNLMTNITKRQGTAMAAEVAGAKQRLERAELAIERSEEMVAQNIERSGRIRRLAEAAIQDR